MSETSHARAETRDERRDWTVDGTQCCARKCWRRKGPRPRRRPRPRHPRPAALAAIDTRCASSKPGGRCSRHSLRHDVRMFQGRPAYDPASSDATPFPFLPPPVPPTRFCMRDPRAKRGRSHAQTQHDPAHFAIASSESYHRMSTQVELHVVKERRRVGPESGSAIRRAATAGARRAAIFRCSRATTRRSCWPHDVAFRRRSRRWQRRSSSPSSRAVVWC